jgi:hypothetical protein
MARRHFGQPGSGVLITVSVLITIMDRQAMLAGFRRPRLRTADRVQRLKRGTEPLAGT